MPDVSCTAAYCSAPSGHCSPFHHSSSSRSALYTTDCVWHAAIQRKVLPDAARAVASPSTCVVFGHGLT